MNVPMYSSLGAADVLKQINPTTVESIEFTRRLNVLHGSHGANGVISIYLKKGVSEDILKHKPNFQTIGMQGYSFPRHFQSPDYTNPKTDSTLSDYRSTLYWNSEVLTDDKTGIVELTFFAADLPGKYRIVVAGVNQNGEPLRCEHFVEVDDSKITE